MLPTEFRLLQLIRKPPGHLEIDFPVPPAEGAFNLFKVAIKIFFSNWIPIGKIVFLFILPYSLLFHSYIYLLKDSIVDPHKWIRTPYELILWGLPQGILMAVVIPSVIYCLIGCLRNGHPPPLRESLRWGLYRAPRFWVWNMIAFIIVAVGLFLFIVPGIILAVRYIFVGAVISVEASGGQSVFKRSKEISSGHGWTIFSAMILCWGLFMLITAPFIAIEHYPLGGLYGILTLILNGIEAEKIVFLTFLVYTIVTPLVSLISQFWVVLILLLYLSLVSAHNSLRIAKIP